MFLLYTKALIRLRHYDNIKVRKVTLYRISVHCGCDILHFTTIYYIRVYYSFCLALWIVKIVFVTLHFTA